MDRLQPYFQYQVCYGVTDRVTFSNGNWLGADIPETQRKPEDVLTCPLIWDFLSEAGAAGWELISILESPAVRGNSVRTYFLKKSCEG